MELPKTPELERLSNPPMTPIREIYSAEAKVTSDPKAWRQVHVTVSRRDPADQAETVVYEYDRNYSMMNTFEPFRQLQGDTWHDYAIISPRYTTFQVLDLASGEIVAERPYAQRPWFRSEKYDEYEVNKREHPEYFEPGGFWANKGPEDTVNAEGFCGVDFYVPDFASEIRIGEGQEREEAIEKYTADEWWQDKLRSMQGRHGFYSGCIWGDDGSWKLRYIDLSRIKEGIVTEDERFGYWELPNGKLKDLISIEDGVLRIPTEFYVNMNGTVSTYYRDNLKWVDDTDDAE